MSGPYRAGDGPIVPRKPLPRIEWVLAAPGTILLIAMAIPTFPLFFFIAMISLMEDGKDGAINIMGNWVSMPSWCIKAIRRLP